VVVDFDGRKRLEDIMFDNIPIWIRVSGIPLGMMNKETGEMIGNEVGVFCGHGLGGGWIRSGTVSSDQG
jgi:hypothetical protein